MLVLFIYFSFRISQMVLKLKHKKNCTDKNMYLKRKEIWVCCLTRDIKALSSNLWGLPRWRSGKNPLANARDGRDVVQSLVLEDPLEEAWQPTPIFLPGKPHGQRSLMGYSPCGYKQSNMTEWLSTQCFILLSVPSSLYDNNSYFTGLL